MTVRTHDFHHEEERNCAICNKRFAIREYEDRQICRACERVAIEVSKLVRK